MSILIKGMEMPTSCWDCYFQDCGNCVLNNHKVVDNCIMEDRRDDDCPLVPVPSHGRLIDADALDVIGYCGIPQGREDTFDSGVMWLAEQIDALPTIIPASGGKEDE